MTAAARDTDSEKAIESPINYKVGIYNISHTSGSDI